MKLFGNAKEANIKLMLLDALIMLGIFIGLEVLAALAGGWLNLGLAILAVFLIFLLYVAALSIYQHYRKN